MAVNNDLNNAALADFLVTSSTAGVDRKLTISNTDNSAVSSPAHLQVTVGGSTNTGDPYINFLVTGAGTFTLGVDNSDSDKFKIANSSALGTTDVITISGSLQTTLTTPITVVQTSNIGAGVQLGVVNTDTSNTASSARLVAGNGGLGGGDAYTLYNMNGYTSNSWETGVDHTTANFKINNNANSSTANLSGTNFWNMTPSGQRTMPYQPAFLAYRNAPIANQTGAGTEIDTPFNAVVYDQGSNFNVTTHAFTAPVTGLYLFETSVTFYNLGAANIYGAVWISASNRYGYVYNGNIGAVRSGGGINNYTAAGSILIDMDAGDVCIVGASADGGAGDTVGIRGSASTALETFFSGHLVA